MTKEELILANVVQKRAIANVVMELLEQRSLGLDGEHLSDLYDRAAEIQFYFENESYKAVPDLKELRKASMKLDHILSDFLPKGKVEIGEPVLVPVGTVKLPPRPPVQVFYGWSDTAEYPTEAAIMASEHSFFIPFGGSFVIPFDQVQDWKHAWFATPDTEPLKTNWDGQNSPLNNGDIGNDNLFGDPVHIGSFYYYFTAFPTIFEMPVVITGGGTVPEVIEPGEIPETTTPEPPTLTADDTLNTLTAAHALGSSEILVSINGAAYVQYTGVINVGDVDRAAGYWKFKIKSAQYRNESAVVESPAFTKVPVVVPDTYMLTVNLSGATGAFTVYINGAPITGNTLTLEAGTILNNITVVKSGHTIEPASVPSVVMDSDITLEFTAIPLPVFRTLTVNISGLSEAYELFINGVAQVGNTFTFADGTILDDIYIQIDNYIITPSIVDSLLMDRNRIISFAAALVKRTLTLNTGGITGTSLYINDVLHTGPLEFNHGTELVNVSVRKSGYTFDPEVIPLVVMDADKELIFEGAEIQQYTLTINVDGVSDYTIEIDGVTQNSGTLVFNEGTLLKNIAVKKEGYVITPGLIDTLLMDGDKVINFTAAEIVIPTYTLTINVPGVTDYTVSIAGVVQSPGILEYTEGTTLVNIKVTKPGWVISPVNITSLLMDSDKELNFEAIELSPEQLITASSYNNYRYSNDSTAVNSTTWFAPKTVFAAAKEFRFEYANSGHSSSSGVTDRIGRVDLTIKASVIFNSIHYPILFNGQNQIILERGGTIVSDIVDISVPEGSVITIATYVVGGEGTFEIPTNFYGSGGAGGGYADYPKGDYTNIPVPGQIRNAPSFGPVGVYAKPINEPTPVVLVCGDSISYGFSNTTTTHRSHIDNILTTLKIPYLNVALIGDTAKWFKNPARSEQRRKLISAGKFTHVISGYGTNDIEQSDSNPGLATIESLKEVSDYLRTLVPVFIQSTLLPKTTSTDSWKTTTNQAIQFRETNRLLVNNWVRDESNLYVDAIVEPTLYAEVDDSNTVTTNGGKWLVDGTNNYPTTDGIHPSAKMYTLLTSSMMEPVEDILSGIIPPIAPLIEVDDTENTLSISHELGESEILVSVNDGPYESYTGVIQVGNVNRPVGYWKTKTRSAPDRPESRVALSPAFTEVILDGFVVNVLQGAPSTEGFIVKAKLIDQSDAVLNVYSDSGRTVLVESSDVSTKDANSIVSMTVSGLNPDTQYYWDITSGGSKQSLTGKTKTFPSGPSSYKILASSCAKGPSSGGTVGSDTGVSNHAVFEHMRTAHSDSLLFIHMGDLHYRDINSNTPALFHGAYDDVLRQSNQQNLYRDMPLVYIYDDHDFGPNDSHSGSVSKPAAISAYKSRVPHYPLPLNSELDPVNQTFVIGRVRYIILDQRSQRVVMDTVLGAAQKQWLKDTLLAATEPVICIETGVPWIATDNQNGWNVAPAERNELKQFFVDNNLVDRIFMIHGDNHMIGIDDGTNSGGYPVFLFASLDSGSSDKGGPYSHGTSRDTAGGQFGTIEITDNGYNKISVKGTARRFKSGSETQVISYTKVFDAPGDPDPNEEIPEVLEPLPGYEFLALPSSHFANNGDGSYTPTQIDVDALLDKKLVGDGALALKYMDTPNNLYAPKLYLMEGYTVNGNNVYYNIRFRGDTTKHLRVRGANQINQDFDYGLDFQQGDYFILEREGGVYYVKRSRDGVIETLTRHTITQLTNTIQYLKIASEGTVWELQTKGFIPV